MKQSSQSRAFLILGVISLGYIIFLSAFYSVYYDSSFYTNAFQEFGVYRVLGNETKPLNTAVLSYLNDREDFPPLLMKEFQQNERSHLTDVKNLMQVLGYLYLIAWLILTAIVGLKKIQLSRLLLYSGLSCLVLLFLLFLGSLSFDNLFLSFHQVFFPQGNYYFSSDQYVITRLYPEAFFASFFERILLYLLFYSGLLLLLSVLIKRFKAWPGSR